MAKAKPPFTAYLSSTLKDLGPEREAVRAALEGICLVKQSYDASEDALVASCLDDVAGCDVYIGILGLRYGHVPLGRFPNPEHLSITELEYRHAGERGIPRLLFLKDENEIKAPQMDVRTKEHPPERVDDFRARVTEEQRPAVFATVADLRELVLKAWRQFERNHPRPTSGRDGGAKTRPRAIHNDIVRRNYMAWLADECERVVLFGLGARDRQGHVRLGQVYVPALTSRRDVTAAPRGAAERAPHEPSDEPLLHRLGRESIYVPGAPGSGKSTFCRWVALSTASGGVPAQALPAPVEFAETLPDSLLGRFPFLCPLREWSVPGSPWLAGNGRWHRKQLEGALSAWIDKASPGGLTSAAFLEALAQGTCVLMLDGVDEIPERIDDHYPRLNFLTGLADAFKTWMKAGNRVLLTSRPYGIETVIGGTLGLPPADLLGLPRELQDVFVRRWYAAAGTREADLKASSLIEHLDDRPDLDELRSNPMLLTALCVKFDENMRLPRDLYRLYSAVTDLVLYKRYPTEPERDLARLRLSAVALAMHQGPPARPRTSPAAEVSIEEVDTALADLARTDRASEQGGIEASEKREQLLSSSGLLLPRAYKRAGFYHLSFQEFLAALRLRRLSGDCRPVLHRHMATAQWRSTLRFLFCATADQSSPEHALSDYAVLLEQLDRDHLAADPNPALVLADCLEVGHARGWRLDEFAPPFRHACRLALEHVEPPARARLWDVLGRIGLDDRPGVGVKDGLPDIDWVEVPAGLFKYGEKRTSVELPAFRIARYPVTNTQFQAFIDDGGFENDAWWQWPERRELPVRPAWSHPTRPRESVSWFDATAFCRWLETRLREGGVLSARENVRLPSEQQWEKAARGTDGREYPWGKSYESGRANINETINNVGPYYLRQTSAVGIYPSGASPYGVLDMSGNVWEWCTDDYDTKMREIDAVKVVRGGSWAINQVNARASYRDVDRPDVRDYDVGFRVVRVSPIG